MTENQEEKHPAVWDYAAEDPQKADYLKDALRVVKDPELGYSVIELGLVRNVVVKDGRVVITMIMTTPFCPYAPQLVEQVRMNAEKAMNMDTAIDLRFDPWDPDMMEEGFSLDWGLY